MEDYSGKKIDRYQIVEIIGEGGMAKVYKAFDTKLKRFVAIKFIIIDFVAPANQKQMLKRFELEALSLAKLDHHNIVQIYDYGDYNSTPYLVMQYLPGGSLQKTKTPMRLKKALGLIIRLADALDYAHHKDLIHRDIKPANILLNDKGEPKLSDFGIAKIINSEYEQTLTLTGMSIGTPYYMSPEQGMGDSVDLRTDIYSIGIVLYELVVGKKPFEANTPLAVLYKQIHEPLPKPSRINSKVPQNLENVIIKALEKDPKDRFQTMLELKNQLQQILDDLEVSDDENIIDYQFNETIELINKANTQNHLVENNITKDNEQDIDDDPENVLNENYVIKSNDLGESSKEINRTGKAQNENDLVDEAKDTTEVDPEDLLRFYNNLTKDEDGPSLVPKIKDDNADDLQKDQQAIENNDNEEKLPEIQALKPGEDLKIPFEKSGKKKSEIIKNPKNILKNKNMIIFVGIVIVFSGFIFFSKNLFGTEMVSTKVADSTPAISFTSEPSKTLTMTSINTATLTLTSFSANPSSTEQPNSIADYRTVETLKHEVIGTVNTKYAGLRPGPFSTDPIKIILEPGTKLNLISKLSNNLWFFVEDEIGNSGWFYIEWMEMEGNIETLPLATSIPTPYPTEIPTSPPNTNKSPSISNPTDTSLPTIDPGSG